MIFTSVVFAIFFFLIAFVYYLIPAKLRWAWLFIASCIFYSNSNPWYILVILSIIIVTFFSALTIEKKRESNKAWQIYLLAILLNVGVLVFFKYSNFFTTAAFDIVNFTRTKFFHANSVLNDSLQVNIIAPLGLSYVTFQAIGYLIEIKRGNHSAEKNLGHFSTYLLFFPKIIAGPVERAHNFLPQLKQVKFFDYNNLSIGFKLVIWGLFKKLVVADRLSIYVSAVLGNASHHSSKSLILASVFYVFQMYADFSGYTDMALGFAKVLGFDLMPNFNRPLFAKSVTEFWRKWHISLSTWFADYFYTPLAIAKRDWGNWSVVYAFFVTFIVLGFWHGANWTFIIFGMLQGFILTLEFFTRKVRKKIRSKLPEVINTVISTVFTIAYFAFSLIFFRANSIADAFTIIKRMFTARGEFYSSNPTMLLFSVLGISFIMLVEFKKEFFNDKFTFSNNENWFIRKTYYCFLLIAVLIAGVFDGGEFIYFQF